MSLCIFSFFHMDIKVHGTSENQATAKTLENAMQNPFSNILVSNWYQASYGKPADF